MNPTNLNRMTGTIDPAYIANIVRHVIARLKTTHTQNASSQTGGLAASISDRIVTAATIEQLTGTPAQVFVATRAIVTPAAKDAAKERGITINRSVGLPPEQVPQPTKQSTHTNTNTREIIDRQDPNRQVAIQNQLERRGIQALRASIVLTDTPAAEVFEQCRTGKRAVMIANISDVNRFAAEMSPDVWVLDMKQMNLIAAVNAVVRINK